MTLELQDFGPQALHVGMRASFQRSVSQIDLDEFANVSWDRNPLHVDESYSATTRFGGCVAHGAFQGAMVSSLVGMLLPGRRALITHINSRFRQPLIIPSDVTVRGELVTWQSEQRIGLVSVTIQRNSDGDTISESDVGITFHDASEKVAAQPLSRSTERHDTGVVLPACDKQCILVTGASGGIGRALVSALSADSTILAVGRSQTALDMFEASDRILTSSIDLRLESAFEQLSDFIGDRVLTGLVHVAWPGMPRGGLLQVSREQVDAQIGFAANGLIELSRLMVRHCDREGGAIVAIGSIVGHHAPNPSVGVYSLGKAVLEDTARLLAPELAAKGISINVVAPSTVATGINKALSERQRLLEQSRIPMARLCKEEDIVASTRFLLSAAGRYISGQRLALSGGQI